MPEPQQRQATASDSPVSSPCIRHCCLDANDMCLGCFRTVDEIAAWSRSSDGTRQRILAQAQQRKRQLGSL
jgi:predicted Fe-S protein YdhL (DUF1289 family)